MTKHNDDPGTDLGERKAKGILFKALVWGFAASFSLNVTFATWMANKVQTMSENIATLVQWKSEGERTDARNEQAIVAIGTELKDHGNRIVVLETKAGISRSP